MNPIATSTYEPADVAVLVKEANDSNVRGVNIVDTFGSLSRSKAIDIYDRFHERLDPEITLGVHLHQNLALSQAIARDVLEHKPDDRDMIIDGSLYGMGRPPGNLQIELIAEHLNNIGYSNYDIRQLFGAIDENIQEMKGNFDWGYSPEYMISAMHNVHRTYAEKMKTDGAPLSDIAEVCRSVSGSTDAIQYNEERIEQYYDQ
jgi:4-hydroxy 2-oxovalerate aldolase